MPDQPEPGTVHYKPVLAVDIETLVADKALLAAELLMLMGCDLGVVRKDKGLHLDRLAVERQRFLRLSLRRVVAPHEWVRRLQRVAQPLLAAKIAMKDQ